MELGGIIITILWFFVSWQLLANFAEEREANEHTLVGEYQGDAQARLFKKVAWGSGLAGIIIGGILIYFFGQYM